MIRLNSFSNCWRRVAISAAACATMVLMGAGCGGDGADSGGRAQVSAGDAGAYIEGKVAETMDSGGYTYVRVESNDGGVWAAGPVTQVAVGELVRISTDMQMDDFRSDTLDRTFDTIYFVSSFSAAPGAGMGGGRTEEALKRMRETNATPSQTPAGGASTIVGREVMDEIEKAPDGLSVAEIFAGKAELAGKAVIVRGKVVKFTPRIMGTNWLHLQDGTCDDESCDLTVTTDAAADVGAVITVRGVLAVDKDFGAGYRYEAIVEGATLEK